MNRNLRIIAGLVVGTCLLGGCADRESREQFRKDTQARLEQLDAKITQLEDRAREAKDDVRPRLEGVLQELREKRRRAADKVREVGNASDDSWSRFKTDAKSAVDDLGEAVDRGFRELVK